MINLPRIVIAVALIALAASPAGGAPVARPNVLVIMGDDHAAYALGCYGSPIVRTPNLDRLAREGVRFDRAYCNSPVCTPSRQSLLTGLMPQSAGVTLLATPLADSAITLADHLKAAGYDTAAFGKMHFNSDSSLRGPGSELRHGFDRIENEATFAAYRRGNPAMPVPPSIRTTGPWRPFNDPAAVWLNSECLPYAARDADMDSTYFARHATEFIRQDRERPFYMVVSFTQPHSPFRFPIEMQGTYRPDEMPVPTVGAQDAPQIPLIFRGLTRPQVQGINAAYYTAVAYLDRKVGEVLTALRESGRDRDTVVIYLGDHGYNLGHHGRFEKHCFYEQAVRAPLIVRWPGRVKPGRTVRGLAEFVDLFPTICEAADIAPPMGLHGRSLMPLLEGKTDRGRDSVVSVYFENEEAMIRTDRWKLIYCTGRRARTDGYATDKPTPGRYVKLFDTRADSGEMRDLSAGPGKSRVVADLKRRLLDRLIACRPPGLRPPVGLSVDDELDWHLVPPEIRGR